MTNVKGIPKTKCQMEHSNGRPVGLDFGYSDFLRHWSFVIRILLQGQGKNGGMPATRLPSIISAT